MRFSKLVAGSVMGSLLAMGLSAPLEAGVITVSAYADASDWVSGDLTTGNPYIHTNATSGLKANQLSQSFTLTDAMTVGTIYLAVKDYNPSANFTIQFYEMPNGANSMNINDWQISKGASFTGVATGPHVSTSGFTVPGSSLSGNTIMKIDLAPSEQTTLAAGEYALVFVGTSSTVRFTWVLTNDTTNYYAGGHGYDGSSSVKSQFSYRDYGMSLVAVPEPGFAALFGLAGLALGGRRPRRRAAA